MQGTMSVTELVSSTQCEFLAARNYELRQGWRLAPCGLPANQPCGQPDCRVHGAVDMLARLAKLGDDHERNFLAQLQERYGADGVVNATNFSVAELLEAVERRVPVLFQAPVHSGNLVGRADFLILEEEDNYAIYDTKLARSAQTSAVLQIAAYARAFDSLGIPINRHGYLVLGSGELTQHSVLDVVPVLDLLQRSYQDLVGNLDPQHPVRWGTVAQGGSGLRSCGRCDTCEEELVPARDVLLVMGCTTGQRLKLNAAGIYTVEDLAVIAEPAGSTFVSGYANTTGIRDNVLLALAAQAQLFLEGEEQNRRFQEAVALAQEGEMETVDSKVQSEGLAGSDQLGEDLVGEKLLDTTREFPGIFRVIDPTAFGLLRAADPEDIFFDFEGDPLYTEQGSHQWGLEYLFGWCTRIIGGDGRPEFHALWAHNRVEERQAFEQFIDYLTERFNRAPGMHVYHYAPYETTALKRLATQYGTREEELDHLLRSGVFIDLFAVVRGGIRTSGRSLSIKKLEPFYAQALGQAREGVTNAADSITAYADAIVERDLGNIAEFEERIRLLTNYNRYDCESTLHLYDWLTGIALEHGVTIPNSRDLALLELEEAYVAPDPDPASIALRQFIDHAAHHQELGEPAAVVARMAWASMDYHKREAKQFWWDHFARLQNPVEDWTGTEIFRPTRAEVVSDWQMVGRERTPSRILRLHGELEPGNKLRDGSQVMSVYDAPAPHGLQESATAQRKYNASSVIIEEIDPVAGTDRVVLTVKEKLPKDVPEFADLPIGLTPPMPISTKAIAERLAEFAQEIAGHVQTKTRCEQVDLPVTARTNLLGRHGAVVEVHTDLKGNHDWSATVVAALEADPQAVVAVQGPPGAGKTYVASHVIANLVAAGWKIAVVAQSHAVVDNVLSAVVKNGNLSEHSVGKRSGTGKTVPEGTSDLNGPKAQKFYAQASGGFVVGGTAWALCADNFLPNGGFDLVVIDEAGQFALANALAVSHAADRILLLGDPQQLPQVSQGVHPEPVNESVLGWMVGTDATIAAQRGFFLDQTWRMHPDLTTPVSELSYEGKLHSVPKTLQRTVENLVPGLHARQLDHLGNVASSIEEANEVVGLIEELLGRIFQLEDSEQPRPLEPQDFIVVAPYNAQVHLLTESLQRAGLDEVAVGTVDKFQGQEAPIAIVSLATSSADEAPRGLEFVRNRNRLNVSISRGQHSAFMVYSKHLLHAVPSRPAQIEEHGAFLRLLAGAVKD